MAQARFYLQKRSGKDHNLPVYLKYTFGKGERLEYYTRLQADSSHYVHKYYAKGKDPFKGAAEPINAKLKTLLNHLSDIETRASLDQVELTKDYLKTELDKRWKPGSKEPEPDLPNFFGMFKKFADETKLSDGRKKHINSVLNFWEAFDKKLTFEDINSGVLKKFERFLKYDKKGKIIRSDNTIHAVMNISRAVWNYALLKYEEQNKTLHYPFKAYEIPSEVYGKPISLTREERDRIYNAKIENKRLDQIRDIFIFQCLTGMRVGDMCRLTRDSIRDGKLYYIARKTKDGLPDTREIDLSKKALAILKKYENVQFPNNMPLPFISDQKYNTYLKELAKLENINLDRVETRMNKRTRETENVKIYDIISSHMARRTTGSVGYASGIATDTLAYLLGHIPGSKATHRYRTITPDLVTNAINLID
jgi:integrase